MDEQRRSADHPVPDVQTPEAYDQGFSWDHSRLVPDLHEDRYSLHEVANLLGMSIDMIRHAVQAGELKAERAGHEIVCIHRDDLLAWLNARGPGV
jgi:excisionase family DNA binding protein